MIITRKSVVLSRKRRGKSRCLPFIKRISSLKLRLWEENCFIRGCCRLTGLKKTALLAKNALPFIRCLLNHGVLVSYPFIPGSRAELPVELWARAWAACANMLSKKLFKSRGKLRPLVKRKELPEGAKCFLKEKYTTFGKLNIPMPWLL